MMSGDGSKATGERAQAEPVISIVVPAYNEVDNLDALLEQIDKALDARADVEFIVVDDGSDDATWDLVCGRCALDPRVKGLRLSKNFGHQSALLAGMRQARGAAVITIDADLQHPPFLIPELLARWEAGARIVHTVRTDTGRETVAKRLTSRLFYAAFAFLSGVHLKPGMADFRLLDRRAVDALLDCGEGEVFLRGLVHWIGFPSATVEFQNQSRHRGDTRYTWRKMLRLA